MKIEMLKIEQIIPYACNPRKNQRAVDKVAASIKEFGFRQPIVVDKEKVIIAGHTRYQAAQKLELKEIPVHIAKDMSEAQANAYRITDNRTSEEAEWDFPMLKVELEKLQELDYDLVETAFSMDEIEKIMNGEELKSKNEDGGSDPSFESKFEVVVVCEDEADQEAVYKLMQSKGYQCRVLSM